MDLGYGKKMVEETSSPLRLLSKHNKSVIARQSTESKDAFFHRKKQFPLALQVPLQQSKELKTTDSKESPSKFLHIVFPLQGWSG